MFQGLVSYFKNRFASLPFEPPFQICMVPPVWNDSDHLEDRWERRSGETIRTLGTAGEALQTVKECEKVFSAHMERWKSPFNGKRYCEETDVFRDSLSGFSENEIVGDVEDVSRIFRKQLRIGYVIVRDPISGLQKEVLEGLNHSLTVLRLEGRIISACRHLIVREEIGPGIIII